MNRREFFQKIASTAAMVSVSSKIIWTERRLPTFDEIVSTTFRKHSRGIAANITSHNALYARLKAAGR